MGTYPYFEKKLSHLSCWGAGRYTLAEDAIGWLVS